MPISAADDVFAAGDNRPAAWRYRDAFGSKIETVRIRSLACALAFGGIFLASLAGALGADDKPSKPAGKPSKQEEKPAKPESPSSKGSGDAAGATDIASLEKELKRAAVSSVPSRAVALTQELLATGDPRAVEAIVQNALSGISYEVERKVGGVLVASTDPKVRAKVLEQARFQNNSRFQSRIILLSIIADWAAEPASLETLHNALKDPHRRVNLTAISLLKRLNKMESVDPLITALEDREKKPHDRVYQDILKTLQAITGSSLEFAPDWRNYWEARKKGASTLPSKKADLVTVTYKRPSFFTVDVDSDRVLFIIDISQSMLKRDPDTAKPVAQAPPPETGGETKGTTVVVKKQPGNKATPKKVRQEDLPPSRERLLRVKEELLRVIKTLESPTRFGILSFSHELQWWGGAKGLKDASATNRTSATNWVRSLVATGATRTDLALEEALSLPDVDTIYLLTDGAPRDERNQDLEVPPILAAVKEKNRFLRCRIHTISFAQIRDKDMLGLVRDLAKQNDGACTLLP